MYDYRRSFAHKFSLAILLLLAMLIPVHAQTGSVMASSQGAMSAAKVTCERWYAVRSNDTLGGIANRFGVEPYQIVNLNKMGSPYTIYTGQKLCIPKPAVHANQLKKLPKKYLNQGAASFSTGWSPTGIVIKPLNFPVKSSMVVKVDDLSNQATEWVKLGVFTTRKGVQEYRLRLPSDLKDAKQLTVCIKNLKTDLLMCRNTPIK